MVDDCSGIGVGAGETEGAVGAGRTSGIEERADRARRDGAKGDGAVGDGGGRTQITGDAQVANRTDA